VILEATSDLDTFSWQNWKTWLVETFGGLSEKFHAKLKLRTRFYKEGESLLNYLTDVLRLCSIVDPKMTESDKTEHLIMGLNSELREMCIMASIETLKQFTKFCENRQKIDDYERPDLDQTKVQTESPISQPEVACAIQPGKCFRCNKSGHFVKDCRVKLDDNQPKERFSRSTRKGSRQRRTYSSSGSSSPEAKPTGKSGFNQAKSRAPSNHVMFTDEQFACLMKSIKPEAEKKEEKQPGEKKKKKHSSPYPTKKSLKQALLATLEDSESSLEVSENEQSENDE
jgi:hypothetical protein